MANPRFSNRGFIVSSSFYLETMPFEWDSEKASDRAHSAGAVTVHGLQHTYATHYYIKHKNDPDFDLATFSKSIGHSSIRTTMEIYAHLDMTQNRFVQRSIDDLKDF